MEFFVPLVPVNTFVFRGAAFTDFLVESVLCECAEAKIFFSVVEAIMVDVVDNKVGRGGSYLSVHSDFFFSFVSDGIADVRFFYYRPFEFFQIVVIGRVDESETAFSEGDFSEEKSVPETADNKKKQREVFLYKH